MELTFVATCLFGLEKLVGEEIDALGYRRVETMDGRVTFTAPAEAVARCNLWLRYAERLYICIGKFPADSFVALFDGTRALPWEEWIAADEAFPVKGHSVKSALVSIPDCQRIIKKAIVERLRAAHGVSTLPETATTKQVVFFLFRDTVALMIDTSGTALHKRGYRPIANAAPLRETLAAALVKLSHPREEILFWDPMCGSGTIPIEAALLMQNRAPGMGRTFAAEQFREFSADIWARAREEAADLVRRDSKFEVRATDIDPAAVEICRANFARAGVAGCATIRVQDALTIATEGRRGTLVLNPPYGERLLSPAEAEELYRKMGKHFATLDDWQIYVLTANELFERAYGRRADRVRKLYNGMIRCFYYQFFKPRKKK